MKDVLGADRIRQAEREAISRGTSEAYLRMNAALALADYVCEYGGNSPIAVFCGAGGNGCDGLLAAVRLKRQGRRVAVYTVGDTDRFDRDALMFARNEGVPVSPYQSYPFDALVIVDAVFGIGLNRPIAGELADFFERINSLGDKVLRIAVDIPSGLNADTGEVMGACIRADVTVSFSCVKKGMLSASGRDNCGRIVVRDVGVKTSSAVHIYEESDFKPYVRKASAHKGTAGRIFIIGGSGDMIGAPIMASAAAHAAYLNGAGTVTVCLPEIHRVAAAARASMAMMKFLPCDKDGFIRFDKDALDGIISRAAAIDIGVGMGKAPELRRIVEYICAEYSGTLVIDADALNAVKLDYAFMKNSPSKIILTPHVGEFERLTGKKATMENAMALASDTGAVVTLKSATTIITDGKDVRVNISGTPAMAKGGMGDVLGGCISALSCAYSPIDAASVACYRNGIGAERAVSSYAQMMLTADDIIKYWANDND